MGCTDKSLRCYFGKMEEKYYSAAKYYQIYYIKNTCEIGIYYNTRNAKQL